MSGSWIRVSAMECHLDARTVNRIVKDALGRRAASVTKSPDLCKEIGEVYVDAVTPFVPMKTGKLRSSGHATSDGRVFWSAHHRGYDYAGIQYATLYSHYTTPGTGPYWTDNVQPGTDNWEQFKFDITPLIIRRFNNG